jgi:hypothetical protein
MVRDLGLSLVVSIACVSAVSGAWSADTSLKAALQSRYLDMKSAVDAHDGAAMAAILAPDFASVDISGRSQTASQMIAEVNAMKPDPNRSSETTLISITPGAKAVTVEQQYDMKTIALRPNGTQHKFEMVALSTDSWVKPADVWLIERTVTTEVSYFTDGRLFEQKRNQ